MSFTPYNGTLTITILEAKQLFNAELVGKQDPYCIVSVGGRKKQTKVHKNGGTAPKWGGSFSFNIGPSFTNDHKDNIKFKIWDSETFRDDFVGSTFLPVSVLIDNPDGYNTSNSHILHPNYNHPPLISQGGSPSSAPPRGSSLPDPFTSRQSSKAPVASPRENL
jgi:Ca2+-dependent lipid-binding protein